MIRKSNAISSLKSFLAFFIVTLLIWLIDESLVDQITLPKFFVYLALATLFCVLSYPSFLICLQKNSEFMPILIIFALPIIIDLPILDNFYGESQRLNGTLMFTAIVLSICFGLIIAQEKRIEQILRYININSLMVCSLIVVSQILSLNSSIFGAWTKPSAQGGINENFKSVFISITAVLLCSTLPRSLSAIKKEKFKLLTLVLNLSALTLIGSLQGFVLLILCGGLFALSSVIKFRAAIPFLSFCFFAGYILAIFNKSLFIYFDSSTRERIKLSQRAIELLESAPLVTPNVTRISESDFSQSIMTTFSGSEAWIDDVHNVYLNIANTFGIFVATLLILMVMTLIIDFTKHLASLSFKARWFGSLLISIALVLNVTLIHVIYFPIVFIILGSYLSLRAEEKGRWSKNKSRLSETIKSNSYYSKFLPPFVSFTILIQSSLALVLLSREYVLQKEVMSFSAKFNNSSVSEFEKFVLPRVQKSQDLRFIYEVGRARYLQKDCYGVRFTLEALNSRSSNHFLTKRLSTLNDDCPASQ